jgi:hypothetical protein
VYACFDSAQLVLADLALCWLNTSLRLAALLWQACSDAGLACLQTKMK